MISANLLAVFYLISGVLFILALRGLSSPETSRQGNLFGIIGMFIAIGVTIISVGNFSTGFIYLLVLIWLSAFIIKEKLIIDESVHPNVSIIISAHNEEQNIKIQEKINNNRT